MAAVYDQPTGTRRIYVNGVEVAKRQDLPITLYSGSVDLIIGAQHSESISGFFKGLIDEVSIYHRALANVAIERLYGASAEARWSGEGDANDTQGGNHGIVVQGVAFAPGLAGQAFAFDGQGSHVLFNPLIGNFGTADFTLELWLWSAQAHQTSQPLLVKYFDLLYLAGIRYSVMSLLTMWIRTKTIRAWVALERPRVPPASIRDPSSLRPSSACMEPTFWQTRCRWWVEGDRSAS